MSMNNNIVSDADKDSWVNHLRKLYQLFVVEKRPQCARQNGSCSYPPLENVPNSVGCAVGCLVSLDLAKDLEDSYYGSIIHDDYKSAGFAKICEELNLSVNEVNYSLLTRLQETHDNNNANKDFKLDESLAECIEEIAQYLKIPYESITNAQPN